LIKNPVKHEEYMLKRKINIQKLESEYKEVKK